MAEIDARAVDALEVEGLGTIRGEEDFRRAASGASDETLRSVLSFCADWCSESPFMTLHTSGSTGAPKAVRARKAHMAASAAMTVERLGLAPGDTSLLVLPMHYIAGQMMVVRAMLRGLRLIVRTPSRHPFAGLSEPPVFTALVPLQAKASLEDPAEKGIMEAVRENIIGGASVDRRLAEALKPFPNRIYSTYGMTETLSHVALRPLTGPEAGSWYEPLLGVTAASSERGTLVISCPAIGVERIETNDIVLFCPGSRRFRILGRTDNVIISGGLKVHAEMLEEAIALRMNHRFAVTSLSDPDLGSAVTIVVEAAPDTPLPDFKKVVAEAGLSPYWKPRRAVFVDALPLTRTGKLDRKGVKNAAASAGIASVRRLP